MGGCSGSLPTTPCPPCPIDALQSHFSEPGDLSLVPSPCNGDREPYGIAAICSPLGPAPVAWLPQHVPGMGNDLPNRMVGVEIMKTYLSAGVASSKQVALPIRVSAARGILSHPALLIALTALPCVPQTSPVLQRRSGLML